MKDPNDAWRAGIDIRAEADAGWNRYRIERLRGDGLDEYGRPFGMDEPATDAGPQSDDIPIDPPDDRQHRRSNGHDAGRADDETATAFVFRDMAQIGDKIEPRNWLLKDWIPLGAVTLFSGKGGIGKTTLGLQLGAAVASGGPFLGREVACGKVLAVCCEDDAAELDRRVNAIKAEFGYILPPDTFRVSEGCDENWLIQMVPGRLAQPTDLYLSLVDAVREFQPRLILLDNTVAFYGGGPGSDITRFLGLMRRLARISGAAVVLFRHPAKADGSEFSGGAEWGNVVRSRLWLFADENDKSRVILQRSKSNYAEPTSNEIVLEMRRGLLFPVVQEIPDTVDTIKNRQQEAADEAAFLEVLRRFKTRGQTLSASRTANNYVVREMLSQREFRGRTRPQVEAVMGRLFDQGRIADGEVFKRNGKPRFGLVERELDGGEA